MEHIPEDFDRGQRDSVADIATGTPKLYWQTRGRWGEFLTQLMVERFGVAVKHTSDITTAAEVSYRRGYNDATRSHIDQTYGQGAYDAAMEEVDRFRMAHYKAQLGDKSPETK
jgi:hypothetical protein